FDHSRTVLRGGRNDGGKQIWVANVDDPQPADSLGAHAAGGRRAFRRTVLVVLPRVLTCAMNKPVLPDSDELVSRIERDLIDSYDEELEMEIEDRNADDVLAGGGSTRSDQERAQRAHYFRELFRLQGELVKLQDWVATTRQKVVILFEGRDAAGKG